ncbi:MAG: oligopeptide/dipeptide ABC transporter ATP-binding protein [Pseudomonadota bacterium]
MTLLSLRDLTISPPTDALAIHALDGLDLDIEAAEQLALLGNRYSGAALLADVLCPPPDCRVRARRGTIWIGTEARGRMSLTRAQKLHPDLVLRAPSDPTAKINGRRSLSHELSLRMKRLGWRDRSLVLDRFADAWRDLGQGDPEAVLARHCTSLSPLERCLVALAFLFTAKPRLIVSEEPRFMDAVLKAVYLTKLANLCRMGRVAHLFTTSSARVAAEVSDRIIVLHAGEIVETGPVADILRAPQHPYTRLVVDLEHGRSRTEGSLLALAGQGPDQPLPENGCRFHPRCSQALAGCFIESPRLASSGDSRVACHRPLGADA